MFMWDIFSKTREEQEPPICYRCNSVT